MLRAQPHRPPHPCPPTGTGQAGTPETRLLGLSPGSPLSKERNSSSDGGSRVHVHPRREAMSRWVGRESNNQGV